MDPLNVFAIRVIAAILFSTMGASEEIKSAIKWYEGLGLSAYQCPGGRWTVGYGHTRTAQPGMVIDKATAERLFEEDVAAKSELIREVITVPLTQYQFDALLSFAFNVKETAFRTSTLVRLVNAKAFERAAREFQRWVFATDQKTGKKRALPGLVARRAREARIFTSGNYA